MFLLLLFYYLVIIFFFFYLLQFLSTCFCFFVYLLIILFCQLQFWDTCFLFLFLFLFMFYFILFLFFLGSITAFEHMFLFSGMESGSSIYGTMSLLCGQGAFLPSRTMPLRMCFKLKSPRMNLHLCPKLGSLRSSQVCHSNVWKYGVVFQERFDLNTKKQ